MRWKERSDPKIGQRKEISRFLFFPRTIRGETRWLEFAKIRQIFKSTHAINGVSVCVWVDEIWME